MRFPTLLLAVACLLPALPGTPLVAQEFRVETEVFYQDQKEPIVETLTIFSGGVVYDFLLTGSKEITMFDRSRNRIVLMAPARKIKTELTTERVLAFIAEMKTQLNDAQRSYLGGTGMELENDEDGWIILRNDRVVYRAQGESPKESGAVADYQQFANWYARVNAMRLGNAPPFARLRLNAVLADRGLVPKTVERTFIRKRGLTEVKETLRSQHLVNWRLSHTDRKMIDQASSCLTSFPTVTILEYLQLNDLAAGAEPAKR